MQEIGIKKKNAVTNILWIGLIVLLLCLGVCIAQVTILKETHADETADDFNVHHKVFSDVTNSSIENVTALTQASADTLAGTNLTAEEINDVIQIGSGDIWVATMFYSDDINDSLYCLDSAPYDQLSEYADALTEEVTRNKNYAGFVADSEGNSSLLVCAPVFQEDVYCGKVCAVVDFNSIFSSQAFDYSRSIGSLYVVTSDMNVKYSMSDMAVTLSEDHDLYYSLLTYSVGGSSEKTRINSIKNDMLKKQEGYIIIQAKSGDNVQVAYSKLSAVPSTYLVCVFIENLVDDQVQKLIFRCVLLSMAITFLFILVLLYVWATAKRTNNTIEKLAYEDPVTKGKNINYFKDFAHSIMNVFKETPFVIYRFDIQNFRYINESYGHTKADGVLQSCIVNFNQIFSEKELCVRMNADQFLAILVNDASLEQKLNEYSAKVNEDARSKGIKYPIKFKTGIYQIKKHDRDLDVMIDHANAARKMAAQDEKKLRTTYTDDIVNRMRKVDRIESEMQRALATGEFKVYYQAKWDIVADHLAGAEALIRWIKPDGTMIYPDEFIPIFEKNGFIEKIDFFVLESVCEEMKKTLDAGGSIFPVSVNQSRLLLHSPDYIDNIERIIKRYEIPAGAIELEITETVFDDDRDRMIETLRKLKKCGVRIAMDDFGSGYSSLNMLKDAPFDIIKIDREFFSESVTSDVSMWILQKIIEMVSGLGMEIICEGVENLDQVDLLKGLGCRLVQGYYYSKPIPYAEYKEKFVAK